MFEELLGNPKSLAELPAIIVPLKTGRGSIVFGLDVRSCEVIADFHILPHSGVLDGYSVIAVVAEARHRALALAEKM